MARDPAGGDGLSLASAAEEPSIDFRDMMESSPNPYMVVDRDYRIVWANEAYLRATMRAFEEIHGLELFDAFPPPDQSTRIQLQESIRRAFDTGETDELALIDYAIRGPDGTMSAHSWSATHTPFPDSSGAIRYVLQHTVDITELQTLRRERDAMGVVDRARAVAQRYHDVAQEIAELRGLLEHAPGFLAVLTGPEHRYLFANAAYRRLLGGRAFVGRTVAEAVPEVADQGFIAVLDRVFASGEPYFGKRDKVVFVDADPANPRETYLEFIFQPIRHQHGQISGILIQGHDVTDQVEADERQRLLVNELNHRVKNTLAVVQGLAQQSFGAEAGGQFAVFSGRLEALANAHTLLTASTWESADLAGLVRGSLEAAAGTAVAQCALSGPAILLPPQLAVAMAMIVHELSTNAIKYGALSNSEGRVTVDWSVVSAEAGERLAMVWQETGGPAVISPLREGFGAKLIRRGLGAQGRAAIEYRPAGVCCQIEAAL